MTKKTWLKITVQTDPLLLEPLADFMVGILEAGVEMAAVDEPGYGSVVAFIEKNDPGQDEINTAVAQVSGYLENMRSVFGVAPENSTVEHEIIEEQDWGRNWKEYFKPFAIVPGLVIAPSWEEYIPAEDESVITMDPGMAFGTGHHDTTLFSLELIRECVFAAGEPNLRLLDVGTGTGILAMAGVIFGCAEAVAIDNDPDAVGASRDNVSRNGLAEKIDVSGADLARVDGVFDIVVANIVHDVLIMLCDELVKRVVPGGVLILSGITPGKQLDNIKTVFTAKGLSVDSERVGQEWAAIRLKK